VFLAQTHVIQACKATRANNEAIRYVHKVIPGDANQRKTEKCVICELDGSFLGEFIKPMGPGNLIIPFKQDSDKFELELYSFASPLITSLSKVSPSTANCTMFAIRSSPSPVLISLVNVPLSQSTASAT
jgi:hypothetical protein